MDEVAVSGVRPEAGQQVPNRRNVEVPGWLPSPEQQLEQIGIGKIEQEREVLGIGGIQCVGMPFQKAPDQQIVLEQSAPRSPAQAAQRLLPSLFER